MTSSSSHAPESVPDRHRETRGRFGVVHGIGLVAIIALVLAISYTMEIRRRVRALVAIELAADRPQLFATIAMRDGAMDGGLLLASHFFHWLRDGGWRQGPPPDWVFGESRFWMVAVRQVRSIDVTLGLSSDWAALAEGLLEFPKLDTIYLHADAPLPPGSEPLFEMLAGARHLRSLAITGNTGWPGSAHITALARNPHLEQVDIEESAINDEALTALAGAPGMKSIRLTYRHSHLSTGIPEVLRKRHPALQLETRRMQRIPGTSTPSPSAGEP